MIFFVPKELLDVFFGALQSGLQAGELVLARSPGRSPAEVDESARHMTTFVVSPLTGPLPRPGIATEGFVSIGSEDFCEALDRVTRGDPTKIEVIVYQVEEGEVKFHGSYRLKG